MICRFCGNENNDSSLNCFICGKPLSSNIANSLVDLNDDNNNTYAINNQNDPYANRFASDTGGGPSIGPQSFSAQIMAGETTKKSSGVAGVAALIIFIIALLAAAWYFVLRDGAQYAYLLNGGKNASDAAASATDAAIIIINRILGICA